MIFKSTELISAIKNFKVCLKVPFLIFFFFFLVTIFLPKIAYIQVPIKEVHFKSIWGNKSNIFSFDMLSFFEPKKLSRTRIDFLRTFTMEKSCHFFFSFGSSRNTSSNFKHYYSGTFMSFAMQYLHRLFKLFSTWQDLWRGRSIDEDFFTVITIVSEYRLNTKSFLYKCPITRLN